MITAGIITIALSLATTPAEVIPNEPIEVEIQQKAMPTLINKEYVAIAVDVAKDYHIAPALIIAIMEVETGGSNDPTIKAKSGSGAVGLMQVKPQYQGDRMKRLGVTDLTDPYSNILTGTDFLYYLFTTYDDIGLVLTAYRYGEYSDQFNYASKTGFIYPYVERVINRSDELQGDYTEL